MYGTIKRTVIARAQPAAISWYDVQISDAVPGDCHGPMGLAMTW